jgi:hypothetical protein
MTFEEALKVLAEREPEKFWLFDEVYPNVRQDWFRYGEPSPANGQTFCYAINGEPTNQITQDVVDGILAAISWMYEVHGHSFGWTYNCYTRSQFLNQDWHNRDCVKPNAGVFYNSKLDAAKAALIEIVRKEYKEKRNED